jgi:hypothetical protein
VQGPGVQGAGGGQQPREPRRRSARGQLILFF